MTSAAGSRSANRLIVRGWSGMLEYSLPADRELVSLQGVTPRVVPSAVEEQGETVVYGDGGYYHVSEGAHTPIFYVACDDAI